MYTGVHACVHVCLFALSFKCQRTHTHPHAKPLCILSHVVFPTFRNSCRRRWAAGVPLPSSIEGGLLLLPSQPQCPGRGMKWAKNTPGQLRGIGLGSGGDTAPTFPSSLLGSHLLRGKKGHPARCFSSQYGPECQGGLGPVLGAKKYSVNGRTSGFLCPATYQLCGLSQIP